jgi:hypothetical protein
MGGASSREQGANSPLPTLQLPSRAHCDTLDGPVVEAARRALDSGQLSPVLAWVRADDKDEIRGAFAQARAVRKLGPEARALADTHFFETLVRIHRAGEGAPFTGLKPAGAKLPPAIVAADAAIAKGSPPRRRSPTATRESPMPGPIARYLSEDHDRLDALLSRATTRPDAIDPEPYEAFRAGLLRHIGLEEKILVTAFRKGGPADPDFDAIARRLRIDHGAITSLLVPSPSHALVAELRSILGPHNALEEAGEGGFYARCDERLASEAEALVERMRAAPPSRTVPHNDGPKVHRTAAAALASSAKQFEPR